MALGVICQKDNILVHEKSKEEHDLRLKRVLVRLKKEGITLNEDKLQVCGGGDKIYRSNY